METVKLSDRIYDSYTIDTPVLIELINSKSIQRLKKISIYGLPGDYYHIKPNTTRYEHSIGVFLLLRKLDATLIEQIAGLLHDISHTAFSHVVDWVLGSGDKESFQDNAHEKFLLKSDVFKILKKYDFDPKVIAKHQDFSLLDREIPSLCADRIDYSIREFPPKMIKLCINNLITKNNRIVFKDYQPASLFARNFLKRQIEHWGDFEAGVRYYTIG